MYEGLTAKVKWKGDYSQSFPVNQGVRQGGILSTHLYKLYINELLLELESNQLGKYVGTTYSRCPAVADDLSLMSECTHEFGAMLNVAHSYACSHRYIIHPEKSVVISRQKAKTEDNSTWQLGDKPIAIAEETTHLGLLRTTRREPRQNVTLKIGIARRTLYTLLNVGCHGLNGLNPKTSVKIYQVYVIPRLLSGLETMHLNKGDIEELELFHRKTLRSIQSFPTCAASAAVHLLVGILPIEAEIHKRQLSLLYSILRSKNETVLEIMNRQSSMPDCSPESYFKKVQDLLELYNLADIPTLQSSLPTKSRWKNTVKRAVNEHWTTILRTELEQKSTAKFCEKTQLEIGKTHPVWDTEDSCNLDVKRSIVKARMLIGLYPPGRFARAQDAVDLCPLCKLEKEDICHIIGRCSETLHIRSEYTKELKTLLDQQLGSSFWKENITSQENLVKLVLDSSFLIHYGEKKRYRDLRHRIESITRKLCHRLHLHRTHKLQMATSAG